MVGHDANVVLVSMPWTTLTEPSLGLGILKAVLEDAGIPCRVRHLNIFLLRHLKATTYYSLANVFALNDFLFSGTLDPSVSSRQRALLRQKAAELLEMSVLDKSAIGGVDGAVDTLLALRTVTIPEWLATCADTIVAGAPTLVGFTCMFDQTIASVALSHLVKQRSPATMIALGGYAVRQPTAECLLESFPWIDAVCSGEGEPVIAALARASAGAMSLEDVPGILWREDGEVRTSAVPPRVDMDTVPVPDYRDFCRDIAELSAADQVDIAIGKLPVENSRGCWWGAIRHCVFCGIHDDDMAFRVKSADAAVAAMDELYRRHGIRGFRFADYILPRAYFDTLLPELARRGAPYDITAEIKANVPAPTFALLAAAGFSELQPGIESFSSAALRDMDKGTSKLRNIQTLVLGAQHGVVIHYNLLYGFPQDRLEDYQELSETLSRLTHLDPPSTRLEVQITRYAPLQVDPARFGIPEAMYEPTYQLIFSAGYLARTGFDLSRYCYYFQRPYENSPALQRMYRRIDGLVDSWRAIRDERSVQLVWRPAPEEHSVFDSRDDAEGTVHRLGDRTASVLRACSTMTSVGDLEQQLKGQMVRAEIEEVLSRLDQLRLVVREREFALSIVLDGSMPEAPVLVGGAAGAPASC